MARMQLEINQWATRFAQLAATNAQSDALARPTTMLELLEHCHRAFVHTLKVERDPTLTTGGSTTAVTNKLRPARLKPWLDFTDYRKKTFTKAKHFLQALPEDQQRCYDNPYEIRGVARNARANVSSEMDLRQYHQNCVEPYVVKVVQQLISLPKAREKLCLGEKMTFENHANTLTNVPSQDPDHEKLYRPKDADQLCVRQDGGDNAAAVIIEFKAPHKATTELLTAGLHAMDVGEVMQLRGNIGTFKIEDRFEKSADLFVAMIVTQTYSYMVQSGISHGCIITGEAMIFLYVRESEPDTVYFYHADPRAEVEEEQRSSGEFPHDCTAIGQLLSFCLMAQSIQLYPQTWRFNVLTRGLRWTYSEAEAEHRIPTEAAAFDRPQSAHKTRDAISKIYRSPHLLRFRPKNCDPDDLAGRRESSSSDDDSGSEYAPDHTPTRPRLRQQQQPNPPGESQPNLKEGQQVSGSRSRTAKDHAFCTQRCLVGLTSRSAMDKMCPNYALHPKAKAGDGHALTRPLLARRLRQQLATDLDDYCVDLGVQGATGRLFKLSLASYGYTFVGKGTVSGYISRSKLEGRVYRHLRERQGQSIPVHLGNIDLIRPWIGGGFDIVHMLLMSWAGYRVMMTNVAQGKAGERLVRDQAKRFNTECIKTGACHRDTYARNMMWNEENQQVMFVDFDLTVLFDTRRTPPPAAFGSMANLFTWQKETKEMIDDNGASVFRFSKQLSTANRKAKQNIAPTKQIRARLDNINIWLDEAEDISGSPTETGVSPRSDTEHPRMSPIIRSNSGMGHRANWPHTLHAGSHHDKVGVQAGSQEAGKSARAPYGEADKENALMVY
ncbi:MAG: hypothetical protein LQ346_007765 [Caloplaca aetnensis]|nr:MAG: hypothetical protein LQ346_007765 [Caloplaca aetnensis]